jgi:hypothetical protein
VTASDFTIKLKLTDT